MLHINRKIVTRVSALVLALMLLFSCTAGFAAASFTKKAAGVKYNKTTLKLGGTTSEKALKKLFGSKYKRVTDDGCTFGYATYQYTFSDKGITVETLQKKKGGKEQIITLTMTKKNVPTIAGLKVGDKTSKIAKLYGKDCKVNKAKTKILYEVGKYYMEITVKKSKVTKITILWDL